MITTVIFGYGKKACRNFYLKVTVTISGRMIFGFNRTFSATMVRASECGLTSGCSQAFRGAVSPRFLWVCHGPGSVSWLWSVQKVSRECPRTVHQDILELATRRAPSHWQHPLGHPDLRGHPPVHFGCSSSLPSLTLKAM